MSKMMYVVYDMDAVDGIAKGQVLKKCKTLFEAKNAIKEEFGEGIVFSFDVHKDGSLINPHLCSVMGGFTPAKK